MVIIDYQQDNFQGIFDYVGYDDQHYIGFLLRGAGVCVLQHGVETPPCHVTSSRTPPRGGNLGCPFYFMGMGLENGRTEEQ